MMKPKLRHLPLAAAALVTCMSAQADYQSPDGNFRLSGFGTVGMVKNGTDDALYNYPGQGGGAGKKGSITPDSKIAVQGTYAISPTFSATTQVMSKYDALGSYAPGIEWMFAKWQATPNLMIRAGKMGAPYFMISDFRDVGYANLTARPNLDVYGQVPVSQLEGADAAYQLNFGDATVTSTLWAGDSKAKFASSLVKTPVNVDIKHQVGLNVLADMGNGLSVRVGRVVGKLTLSSELGETLTSSAALAKAGLNSYAATAGGFGDAASAAQATAAASALTGMGALVDPTSVFASFTGIGLAYDQGNWTGSLEYTKRKTDSFVSDTTGWYGNIGYRINKFTPYFGLSKVKSDRRTSNSVVPTSLHTGVLAGLSGAAMTNAIALDTATAQLYGGVGAILNVEKHDERGTTLGVRWDATSSTAVKFQWDRVNKSADSNGMFLVADPTKASAQAFTAEKRDVNVLSVSVDFVF